VRVGIAIVLAATVAMPERELVLFPVAPGKHVVAIVGGAAVTVTDDMTVGQVRFCVVGDGGIAATPYARRSRIEYAPIGHGNSDVPVYRHRDSGPHVLLDPLWSWVTQ